MAVVTVSGHACAAPIQYNMERLPYSLSQGAPRALAQECRLAQLDGRGRWRT